jgi:hypothetical protein
MKPDWKDAPEWAKWLTGDHLGFTFWQFEPIKHPWRGMPIWCAGSGGAMKSFPADSRSELFKEPRP